MAEKDKDDKKPRKPFGQRVQDALLSVTGADKVVAGFETAGIGPTKEDKANPAFQTRGVFDQTKWEQAQNMNKKKHLVKSK